MFPVKILFLILCLPFAAFAEIHGAKPQEAPPAPPDMEPPSVTQSVRPTARRPPSDAPRADRRLTTMSEQVSNAAKSGATRKLEELSNLLVYDPMAPNLNSSDP